jgi:hypothetical protein
MDAPHTYRLPEECQTEEKCQTDGHAQADGLICEEPNQGHRPKKRRGRPPGPKDRKPAREHPTWTVRDVAAVAQVYAYMIAKESGLTLGEVVTAAVEEYWASRSPGSNKNVEQKYSTIHAQRDQPYSDPQVQAEMDEFRAKREARRLHSCSPGGLRFEDQSGGT